MADTVTIRDDLEAKARKAMAELAALPRARRWDVEAERSRLKAEVQSLIDEWLRAG